MPDPKKHIGKKSCECFKCGERDFYMNSAGGLVCYQCSPPRKEAECLIRYRNEDGIWQDRSLSSGCQQTGQIGDSLIVSTDPACRGIHVTTTSRPMMRVNGQLTAKEIEIYSSDLVWQETGEQWVIFGKPRTTVVKDVVTSVVKRMHELQAQNEMIEMLGMSPSVGDVVNINHTVALFGGRVRPGEVTVTAVIKDAFGNCLVEISRGDRVLAQGLSWPIN